MQHPQADRIAELADRYGRMVFTTAYRILGNAQDAEDALQDAFLKLIRRNGNARPDVQDWGGYLKVTATRCAIDLLRRRSTASTQDLESIDRDDSSVGDPSLMACQKEKAHMLRDALTRIPPRDALVFTLRFFDDLSYETIAAEMDLSVSQVGVILHRTRNRLREMLERTAGTVQPSHIRGENENVG